MVSNSFNRKEGKEKTELIELLTASKGFPVWHHTLNLPRSLDLLYPINSQ